MAKRKPLPRTELDKLNRELFDIQRRVATLRADASIRVHTLEARPYMDTLDIVHELIGNAKKLLYKAIDELDAQPKPEPKE